MVEEFIGAYKTDEKSLNQPPPPPVELFTTTVSYVLELSVAETQAKASTLSSVGVEKRSSKCWGDWTLTAVKNVEFPQEFPICYFAYYLP